MESASDLNPPQIICSSSNQSINQIPKSNNPSFPFKESSEIENVNSETLQKFQSEDEAYGDFEIGRSLSFHPSLTAIRSFSKRDSVNQPFERVESVEYFGDDSEKNAAKSARREDKREGGARTCKCAMKKTMMKEKEINQEKQ